jgi:GT2 family glycosyltransferase
MEMSSPQLTVSIVTFNSDIAMVTATLDALRASSIALDITIIDQTPDMAYMDRLMHLAGEGVRVLRSPRNGGYGFGHNRAIAHAVAAPYHLIINPDVVVHAQCLELLIATLHAQPDVALAMPLILNTDGSVQHLNKNDPTVSDLVLRRFMPGLVQRMAWATRRMQRYVRMDRGYDRPSEIPYASGCFMLFRRSVLGALGGFDERFFMYFEDADISRRARAIGRILFVPEARITHHWARGSYTSWKLMWCTITSAYRYFQRWGWRW